MHESMSREAYNKAFANIYYWKAEVENYPSIQNRAGFRWCRLLIQKLQYKQIKEQDWMRSNWELKVQPDGKIDAIVYRKYFNEIPKIIPAPFQLTFTMTP